ncbi:MAG: ATP-dependent zinc metalloprotease FtsH [Candidatus Latescibacteria bacterium]|nr:ATP-dependent zinc metalloprotease FtsH [Candidatus Latescibacterota bacterium]
MNTENDDNVVYNGKTPKSSNPKHDRRDLLRKRKQPTPPPSSGKPGGKYGWPFGHRVAFIVLLALLGVLLWKQMNSQTANYKRINYTQFETLVAAQKIKKAKIQNTRLEAELTEPLKLGGTEDNRTYPGIIVNIGEYDQSFKDRLVNLNIDLTIAAERTWMNILMTSLPWILIFGIWLFIIRQMQGGPKGVFTFGKSKAKLMAENHHKVTFADVAGVDEAKVELQEVIEFLKDPGKFQRLGGKIPKGALLIGPPGTGKTLLARAVAGEAEVPFFSMSGSDFVEMFVGVGASRVRDLFEQGKSSAPCIIFIDEIDAVGRQRGAGIGGGHDEREQTLNQLLVEMDGFESNEGVILLAATNRPDVLDPALLRPGRFDRQIVVDWPDVKAREMILKVHMKNIKVDSKVDMASIAKGTPGMTGADLANVVNEAALLAARLDRNEVTMVDFEEAKDKTMMGSARKSLVITDEEKRLTAYHEAGHVLVSKFVPQSDPVHKVSIVARGRALGLTHFLPQDERHNWSYNYCMGKLTVLLGGRAAEIVRIGDITNGASNDIEQATTMARKMVCEWGMSRRLGPLTFGKKENEIFLGREIATHKDFSEETSVAIDQEIRRIVETAQQQAESIILEHTSKLEVLTAELLKREVLAGDEIDRILNSHLSGSKKQNMNRRRRPSQKSRNKQSSDRSRPRNETDNSTTDMASQTTGADKNVPVNMQQTGIVDEKASIQKKNHNDVYKENKKTNDSDKKADDSENQKDDVIKARRTRMIRMKTGGRRRVIKKAPAQKIRKIK